MWKNGPSEGAVIRVAIVLVFLGSGVYQMVQGRQVSPEYIGLLMFIVAYYFKKAVAGKG